MAPGTFRFDRFVLDAEDRQLRRDGVPVDLNARYLDALALLVREGGRLVSKDRFHDEVWRGAPVTDEALTQCVRTLRRQLGDDAANPRFIETVPKHGYRFIAPVQQGAGPEAPPTSQPEPEVVQTAPARPWPRLLGVGTAGTLGGGLAGVFVGLFYGFAAASGPEQAGMGAASVLLVLVCISIVLGLIAGAGVSFGIAAADLASGRPWLWRPAGGAAGGLVVGAFGKLLGLDAFVLLFGRSPGDITGAPEGVAMGAAVGLGAWLASRGGASRPLGRGVALGALVGGSAGALLPLLGGRLMGGSLDLLARGFPGSHVRLDQIGAAFGERGFGLVSQVVTGGLEGALFAGCIVGAIAAASRDGEARQRRGTGSARGL